MIRDYIARVVIDRYNVMTKNTATGTNMLTMDGLTQQSILINYTKTIVITLIKLLS